MRHHFLLQQSLLPNSMKSQGVKRALESHSAAHPEAEEHLRNAYLQMGLGWIGPNEKRFIIPASSADMPQLPDRCTWRLWDCCAQRSSKCLYSACEGPTITPQTISLPLLERIHPKSYLSDIQTTKTLFDVFEIDTPEELELPSDDNSCTRIFDPVRRIVGGTVLGAALAFARGSSVVVDAGMHHASTEVYGGSNFLCNVPLSWHILREQLILLKIDSSPTCLYINVDVHQCDGFSHAKDELKMHESFRIVDLYNESIWPQDQDALNFVDIGKGFKSGIGSKAYLELMREASIQVEQADWNP